MDQPRLEVVLRHHRCRQRVGGALPPPLLCWLVLTFVAGFQTLGSLVRLTVGETRWRSFEKYSLRYTRGKSKGRLVPDPHHFRVNAVDFFLELGRISWRAPTAYLLPLAVLPSFLYAVSDSPKSALLTDILAVSFSFNAISLVQLDSFLAGSVVLGGLFVYDVWWVFGTEVVSASARVYTAGGY